MNVTEQIEIMKVETRLANRANAEGLRNWTPEARAASLAVRRAAGSVWGWNKRTRATPKPYTSEAFDRSMEAMTEDAEAIRRSQASGVPTISAPSKYAEELAAQRLESFKAWLAEVKRVEGAIDDFNGTVAALGGLTGGMAKAQRGQSIGPVTADAAAEAAARKAAVEKSIRRNFEKRNADYLRENPDDRSTMLDMVAEKAEYYSAQPARKVEIEKNAYRRIRDSGSETLRETPASKGSDYGTLLEAKRSYVREREAVRPQLQQDEVAYPVGNGVWIGRLPNGDERVISAVPETGWLYNRHTAACAASQSAGSECTCSCGGSQHGQGGTPTKDERLTEIKSLLKERDDKGLRVPDMQRLEKLIEGFEELYGRKPNLKSKNDMAEIERLNVEYFEGKESDPPPPSSEESANWDTLVSGFKTMIAKGAKPTLRNLRSQLLKDHDEKKFKLAKDALAEAWHTTSLDKFQDGFDREPKNNFEFRTFQKKTGVPPEFIGGK